MLRRVGLSLLIAAVTFFGLAPAASATSQFPTTVALPNGFRPEGIAIGPGPVAYFGSLGNGAIYQANLLTGRGRIISEGPGTPSVGMKTDARGRLFVAGGVAGNARVVDTRTGRVLASYQLATGDSFVNDVVLTPHAAWFTDSRNPVLYRLPLTRGRLPAEAQVVPLTGDIVFQEGNNSNGIARTPDGRGLLLIQSNTGLLFRVEPSGVAHQVSVPLALTNGDGLLLRGSTLYVVQNRQNTVTVLKLRGDTARLVKQITDPRFDVPTTVGFFAGRLYLPNARFTTTPTPETIYSVNAVPT
jgi:sugar lactone lactonase YvrE